MATPGIVKRTSPALIEATSPVLTYAFHFLELPREIRDLIYKYALLSPHTWIHTTHEARICYVDRKPLRPHESTQYWGTEQSTRLFRVNHQICNEATEIFYSTFPFHFTFTTTLSFINRCLHDTLPQRARQLIQIVGFVYHIKVTIGPFTLSNDEQHRDTVQAAVDLLPNIKRVNLTLFVVGRDVPEWQIKGVVERTMRDLSPLIGLPHIVLRHTSNVTNQRKRLFSQVCEALECIRGKPVGVTNEF